MHKHSDGRLPEQVLVIKRELVNYLPQRAFVRDASILPSLVESTEYRERDLVEHDLNYKQLIAYCILTYEHYTIHYRRSPSVTEKRLRGLYSIGWGGHVNITDTVLPLWNDRNIGQAMYREVREEIDVSTVETPEILGIINDEDTDVGRVHLGIVYQFRLSSPAFRRRYKQGHDRVKLVDISTVITNLDLYETWSRMIIEECFMGAANLA